MLNWYSRQTHETQEAVVLVIGQLLGMSLNTANHHLFKEIAHGAHLPVVEISLGVFFLLMWRAMKKFLGEIRTNWPRYLVAGFLLIAVAGMVLPATGSAISLILTGHDPIMAITATPTDIAFSRTSAVLAGASTHSIIILEALAVIDDILGSMLLNVVNLVSGRVSIMGMVFGFLLLFVGRQVALRTHPLIAAPALWFGLYFVGFHPVFWLVAAYEFTRRENHKEYLDKFARALVVPVLFMFAFVTAEFNFNLHVTQDMVEVVGSTAGAGIVLKFVAFYVGLTILSKRLNLGFKDRIMISIAAGCLFKVMGILALAIQPIIGAEYVEFILIGSNLTFPIVLIVALLVRASFWLYNQGQEKTLPVREEAFSDPDAF